MRYNYTKAMILCRCDFKWDLCVPVGLEIPESLSCRPGKPIAERNNARSDIYCPNCRTTLFSSDQELRTRLERELRRVFTAAPSSWTVADRDRRTMRTNPSQPVTVDRSPPEPLTPTELRSWMSEQTVFVSSVMTGMAAEREAARDAVESLGGKVLMFERLGGRDDDARTAYLTGVQLSDTYVGILGARYGKPERTGYSPTHMEYNEAVKIGLRISVWTTTGEVDGRQRDFLEEVRTFYTTGSYSSPAQLRKRLERRLADMASATASPWCKVGPVLLRARRYADDGTRIRVKASIRDDNVLAELERLRPDNWQRNSSRITCAGRSHPVNIDNVLVEATAGRSRLVQIEATKADEPYDPPLRSGSSRVNRTAPNQRFWRAHPSADRE